MFFTSTNFQTVSAPFRGVSWIYENNLNPGECGFIENKSFELVESPAAEKFSQLLSFVSTPFSNALQVLKSDKAIGLSGSFNYLLAQNVVRVLLKSRHFATKTFQDAFSAFRSFALERASGVLNSLAEKVQGFTAFNETIGRGNDPVNAPVNAKHVCAARFRVFGLDVEDYVKFIFALVVSEFTASPIHLSNQVTLVCAEKKRNVLNAPLRCSKSDGLSMRIITHGIFVQWQIVWMKLCTAGRSFHFGHSLYSQAHAHRRQIANLTYRLIADAVQSKLIKFFSFKGNCCNLRACFSERCHCRKNGGSLFKIGSYFTFKHANH